MERSTCGTRFLQDLKHSRCPMIFEWPFFSSPRVHEATGPTTEKKSVLCFNKRTVSFISYKRIEIKVFLLLASPSSSAREISSRFQVCVRKLVDVLLQQFFRDCKIASTKENLLSVDGERHKHTVQYSTTSP